VHKRDIFKANEALVCVRGIPPQAMPYDNVGEQFAHDKSLLVLERVVFNPSEELRKHVHSVVVIADTDSCVLDCCAVRRVGIFDEAVVGAV
jgi:hypothetical protein